MVFYILKQEEEKMTIVVI